MFRDSLQFWCFYLGPLSCLSSFPQLRDTTLADNCVLSKMSGRPNQSHYQALAFFAIVPRHQSQWYYGHCRGSLSGGLDLLHDDDDDDDHYNFVFKQRIF